MERINKIINNSKFRELLNKLNNLEKDRIYCRHNMEHFLDVARIGALLNEDENLGYNRELIYSAALLHDLGRVTEYEAGTPHDEASVDIAKRILAACDFDDEEIVIVTEAIASHRRYKMEDTDRTFGALLYRADKLSRNCMLCDAPGCKIPMDKRNISLLL